MDPNRRLLWVCTTDYDVIACLTGIIVSDWLECAIIRVGGKQQQQYVVHSLASAN